MTFQNIMEAAEFLENENDLLEINKWKEISEKNNFFITFWGHYSAGKSKLINNILDKDILPVQTRETTALLTYIQYGEEEKVILTFHDGTVREEDLDILKYVFQNTNDFDELDQIDYIEVFIKSEILKNGLILVDTPGINTIIENHQNLAVSSIEQSGRILYVLGNAPSNVDKQFTKRIVDCGIDCTFIRTKCDKFIEDEEDIEESLKKEKEELASFVNHSIEFIPVSNEKTNKWFGNIEKVRDFLKQISKNIIDEIHNANNKKIVLYAEHYKGELEKEIKRLADIQDGEKNNIKKEVDVCEEELKNLENKIKFIEGDIKEKLRSSKRHSANSIDFLISDEIDEFSDMVQQIDYESDVTKIIPEIYSEKMSSSIKRIQAVLNSDFEEIIQEENQSLMDCLKNQSINLAVPTYAEVQQDNSQMLDMYRMKYANVIEELKRIKKEKDNFSQVEIDFDETEYDETIAELERQLSQIPNDVSYCYCEDDSVKPSQIFKKTGNVIDIALFLLPGSAIFKGIKGIANTTKIAQTIHKTGKIGEVILKAGKTVGQNANIIDHMRDIGYGISKVMAKRSYSTQDEKQKAEEIINKTAGAAEIGFNTYKDRKKSGNVLDALSVSYWMEKFGSQFDAPPRIEIDVEKEKEKNEQRRRISEEKRRISNEKIQRKRELGIIKSKEEELELREKEAESNKILIEEELQYYQKEIEENSKRKACKLYKDSYIEFYRNNICYFSNTLIEDYYNKAKQNITMYISRNYAQLFQNIEEEKKHMNSLLELDHTNNNSIQEKLSECKRILINLEK